MAYRKYSDGKIYSDLYRVEGICELCGLHYLLPCNGKKSIIQYRTREIYAYRITVSGVNAGLEGCAQEPIPDELEN